MTLFKGFGKVNKKRGRGQWARMLFISFAMVSMIAACTSLSLNSKKQEDTPVKEVKTPSWDTYLKNQERHGTTDDTIKLPFGFYWSFDITKLNLSLDVSSVLNILPYHPTQNSSPAVVDDIAYIGSMDRIFYAMDLNSKKILWEFKTTGAVESSPTVFSSKVYFGTNDGILYCLDAKNGKEIWQFKVKTEIISSPLIASGMVYFSTVDDKLYAVNVSTGEKIWHYSRSSIKKITKRQYASPAYYNNMVYMLFSDGYLANLDASTGKELWKRKIRDENMTQYARSTPTMDNGRLYVINSERNVVVLDADKGGEKWKFDALQSVDFAIKKNVIFLLHPEGQVYAVNKITGENLWRRKVAKGSPISAIVAGNHLIVVSNYTTIPFDLEILTRRGSFIDVFTLDNGELIWSEDIGSAISTTPAAAYNKLLFVSDKGKLYVYKGKQ